MDSKRNKTRLTNNICRDEESDFVISRALNIDEIVRHVLVYLDYHTALNARLINRKWYILATCATRKRPSSVTICKENIQNLIAILQKSDFFPSCRLYIRGFMAQEYLEELEILTVHDICSLNLESLRPTTCAEQILTLLYYVRHTLVELTLTTKLQTYPCSKINFSLPALQKVDFINCSSDSEFCCKQETLGWALIIASPALKVVNGLIADVGFEAFWKTVGPRIKIFNGSCYHSPANIKILAGSSAQLDDIVTHAYMRDPPELAEDLLSSTLELIRSSSLSLTKLATNGVVLSSAISDSQFPPLKNLKKLTISVPSDLNVLGYFGVENFSLERFRRALPCIETVSIVKITRWFENTGNFEHLIPNGILSVRNLELVNIEVAESDTELTDPTRCLAESVYQKLLKQLQQLFPAVKSVNVVDICSETSIAPLMTIWSLNSLTVHMKVVVKCGIAVCIKNVVKAAISQGHRLPQSRLQIIIKLDLSNVVSMYNDVSKELNLFADLKVLHPWITISLKYYTPYRYSNFWRSWFSKNYSAVLDVSTCAWFWNDISPAANF